MTAARTNFFTEREMRGDGQMIIEELSDETLKTLHQLIRQAQWADDHLPREEKRYGVREYPDWRMQADRFEAEMSRRRIVFQPLDW